jgi:hypothetical protein
MVANDWVDKRLGPASITAEEYETAAADFKAAVAEAAQQINELKATNPKDAIGSDKMPLHLWPMSATIAGCLGLLDGMLKYGRANWRQSGVRASIYFDALLRHWLKLFEGESVDEDSGLPHECHMLACLAIMVDAKATGNYIDDRQFCGEGVIEFLKRMTPHVARLKAKHADKTPHHYTIKDTKNESIVHA